MKERNYGIDILKSVSMLLVVLLHVLGVGNILGAAQPGTLAYNGAWYLETLALCAVNCFGLASGYVLCKGHYRYSRIFSLWVRVVCEMLAVTAAFALFAPSLVTRHEWFTALTPIYHNVYWYFTSYLILFFFVPYLNRMLLALSAGERKGLSITILALGCVVENVAPGDIFFLNGGYSFLWLAALYVLGACLRLADLNDERIDRRVYLAAFFAAAVPTWYLTIHFQSQRFECYTMPLILLEAVFLLLYFRRLPIARDKKHTAISMFSRTSFGVYIIHTVPLVWKYLLTNRFVPYLDLRFRYMIPAILLTAIAIYLACTLLDWLVEKLLKLVHIQLVEQQIDRFADRAGEKLQKTGENR